MAEKLQKLTKNLDYDFSNKTLLLSALSHRSLGNQNYERLEFLGDAVLNFVIAAELFERFPKAKEGELSRLRASLVKRETLALMAKEFHIGEYLRLGVGELKTGGYHRESILADAMEAVIGAIFLDSDFMTCRQKILQWFEERLTKVSHVKISKDFKTQLQEYTQAKKLALPVYEIMEIAGEAHAQTFYIQCSIISLPHVTQGIGNSRRKAEQEAAEKMLELINGKFNE